MTPRTVRPSARARSASGPASAGSQPQRGRPTLTSISTSRTPPAAAAARVASESTATVTRAVPAATSAPRRVQSSTSLASSRSSPRPAAAMPSISRTVAQQKVRCPASASRRASAVDLNAFTWGRSRGPGWAAAMVATLWSNAAASTASAGVGTSASFTGGDLTRALPVSPVHHLECSLSALCVHPKGRAAPKDLTTSARGAQYEQSGRGRGRDPGHALHGPEVWAVLSVPGVSGR